MLSQCFKMEIQSIIDIRAFVVYYLNGQKMNWIWIMLSFHKRQIRTASLLLSLHFIHQLHTTKHFYQNSFEKKNQQKLKRKHTHTHTYTLNLDQREIAVILAYSRKFTIPSSYQQSITNIYVRANNKICGFGWPVF